MQSALKIRWDSILLGMLIVSNFLVDSISAKIQIDNLFPFFILLLGILSFVNSGIKIEKNFSLAVYLFGLLLLFSLQTLFGFLVVGSNASKQFALCFISIGLPGLLLGQKQFEPMTIRHTIQIVALLSISYFIQLIRYPFTVYESGIQMGVAYSVVPILCTSIWILSSNEETIFWKVISLFVSGMSLWVLFKLMTRGALVCIFAFVTILLFRKMKISLRTKIKVVLICSLISIVYMLFIRKYITESTWYHSIFLQKSDDILNGREMDYIIAFTWRDLFYFFFGSGVGSFSAQFHSLYIHNLFGQIYYEQGAFTLLFVIAVIVRSIRIEKRIENEQGTLLLLLLCASIIRLMVSYYYWIDPLFWVFISVVLKTPKENGEKELKSANSTSEQLKSYLLNFR